ncbi:MAG: ice-binding family protein [Candidatus Doudnabacteria bacterium]
MKKLNKNLIYSILIISLALGFVGPIAALAATTPSLGAASTYGVLANTYTNTVAGTTINGGVGFTTGPAVIPAGVHANYGSGAPYATAGIDQGTALSALNLQPCTFTFAPGAINLSTDITHGPIGVYTPGVYCSTGAMNIGGPLTLNGSGTYIFRPDGALTSTAGAVVTLTDASACNIFWTPTQATTLAANTTFSGIVIDNAGITIGANTTWTGMALAFGGTVTTDTDTITVPTCATEPAPIGIRYGTINVVKNVINDNGGTKTIADFPLFVNGMSVISGITNTFRAPNDLFTITETSDSKYTRTFSGDCDVNGQLNLSPGDNKFCIITNDDVGAPKITPPIPPLIDVVKVPSPLSLAGPGPVSYTFTLSNIGTVPVTNITMVGDTCSPIILTSGDTNSDAKLDLNEKWVYKCSTTLLETHTNTVVTTGWANGLSATDIASATVGVGISITPPLIHVTKIPSPLALLAGGGLVTYTEKISNPGLVALSNVRLTDDKCSPVNYVSGDINGDSKLDTTETWTYTCQSNLTKTTTNTAVASGEANSMTVRDFAIATVVVAVPGLPNAGLAPEVKITWGNIFVLASLLILSSGIFVFALKKRKI